MDPGWLVVSGGEAALENGLTFASEGFPERVLTGMGRDLTPSAWCGDRFAQESSSPGALLVKEVFRSGR